MIPRYCFYRFFHLQEWIYASITHSYVTANFCLQKGTVVEKLVEETANNDQHLRHLISICEGTLMKVVNWFWLACSSKMCRELRLILALLCVAFLAQRQVGETALNDTSSRSHQIIRLVSLIDYSFSWSLEKTNFYLKLISFFGLWQWRVYKVHSEKIQIVWDLLLQAW